MEIRIEGQFSKAEVDELRTEMIGALISLDTGFDSDRVLKILGELTEAQISSFKSFLLRLLGAKTIKTLVITKGEDKIEIENVDPNDLNTVVIAIQKMSTSLKQDDKDAD
ncbi:hypothetical protein [uncultured Cohaesibacter sp.]|uniref:hypothetical protein n=1 Tax=uncultured Cohaesibacter sp. TaxID=1002546 RepID=UPI00292D9AC0|nr:hypothetical protein [uncultured Cohaesibacter sp.]